MIEDTVRLTVSFSCTLEIQREDDRKQAIEQAKARMQNQLPKILDGEEIGGLYDGYMTITGTEVDCVEEY